ncbi:hypothetical protein RZO89_15140, partial [Enterobacter sp. 23-M-SZ-13]|nr:hypothetical protein [Enterobacter sp. 23-M-SZ-13]
GPDPRNFNQRVSLGRNDLLIRTFPREISDGEKKLLTLVANGDEEFVKEKLPLLADKKYIVYANNPDEIAEQLHNLLR